VGAQCEGAIQPVASPAPRKKSAGKTRKKCCRRLAPKVVYRRPTSPLDFFFFFLPPKIWWISSCPTYPTPKVNPFGYAADGDISKMGGEIKMQTDYFFRMYFPLNNKAFWKHRLRSVTAVET
jgi:hypothetical protein